MNALHLLWIVPLAFSLGYIICALLSVSSEEENENMSKKQEMAAVSKIQRQLGVLEGIAIGLEERFATVLLDTVEELAHAVEELLQTKKS